MSSNNFYIMKINNETKPSVEKILFLTNILLYIKVSEKFKTENNCYVFLIPLYIRQKFHYTNVTNISEYKLRIEQKNPFTLKF